MRIHLQLHIKQRHFFQRQAAECRQIQSCVFLRGASESDCALRGRYRRSAVQLQPVGDLRTLRSQSQEALNVHTGLSRQRLCCTDCLFQVPGRHSGQPALC